jgi:hypothetical protein
MLTCHVYYNNQSITITALLNQVSVNQTRSSVFVSNVFIITGKSIIFVTYYCTGMIYFNYDKSECPGKASAFKGIQATKLKSQSRSIMKNEMLD